MCTKCNTRAQWGLAYFWECKLGLFGRLNLFVCHSNAIARVISNIEQVWREQHGRRLVTEVTTVDQNDCPIGGWYENSTVDSCSILRAKKCIARLC
jgi:hypothetical protein